MKFQEYKKQVIQKVNIEQKCQHNNYSLKYQIYLENQQEDFMNNYNYQQQMIKKKII